MMIGIVHQWFEKAFADLHSFAALSSTVVSLLGLLASLSTTMITEYVTRRHKKTIRAESEKNFTIGTSATISNARSSEHWNESVSEGASSSYSDFSSTSRGNSNTYSVGEAGTAGSSVHWRTTDSGQEVRGYLATSGARDQVRKRLEEIIEERERQQTLAKWSRITSRTLTFGQYIIGAMLTTSLAQGAISKTWLSIFGLLVLLCSATKQHFRVDENAQAADVQFRKLRSLVRYTQDQIAILEVRSANGEDRTDAYIALLNQITESLNQIESNDAPYISKQALPS